jgi:hypothetical protein
MEDIAELVELVELFMASQVGDLDEFERHRARSWSEGFTYLPLRAFVTQMSAAIDLVYAWTALNAPCVAQPSGKIVQLAPYLYRKCAWGQAH